jgi:hypothetical protein
MVEERKTEQAFSAKERRKESTWKTEVWMGWYQNGS